MAWGIFLSSADCSVMTNLSRKATSAVEGRFEAENPRHIAILDAYNMATGTSRTSVLNGLLADWAEKQARIADRIRNVTNGAVIPSDSESWRSGTGSRD
jgi:hypothetical protein